MVMETPATIASNTSTERTGTATSTAASTDGTNYESVPHFNPQSLGREFVRQYYTVLNQGPHILHRFYSEDSSLAHGGSTKPGETSMPAFGQIEIYNKITSLDFKDCHTKIRQVDSLETVGKGVVVQVIGELSNNGEPMRRFFQTFVLSPRSPSNYYVRNDIFRYQDEVFVDDEDYSEVEKTEEVEKFDNAQITQVVVEKSEPVANISTPKDDVFEPVNANVNINANNSVSNANVNGNMMHESGEAEKIIENNVDGAICCKDRAITPPAEDQDWNAVNAREDVANESVSHNSEDANTPTPPPQQNLHQNEPQTYATMVSKNPGVPVFSNAPPFSNAPSTFIAKTSEGTVPALGAPFSKPASIENVPVSTTSTPVTPVSAPFTAPSSGGPIVGSGSGSGGKPPVNVHQREQRDQRDQRMGRQRNDRLKGRNDPREVTPGRGENESSYSEPGDYAPRRQQYGDDQQVFVGNLPQDIQEEQLRNFFAKFGNIIDVRINRTNQKAGRTPNYGFVTFDDSRVVRQILTQKPIYFNEHRFNVEEKRSQSNRGGGERGNMSGRSGSGGGGQGMFTQQLFQQRTAVYKKNRLTNVNPKDDKGNIKR